jgi:Rod binding domain-containing protein
MAIAPLQSSRVDAAKLPLESLARNRQVPESEKVAQASRAFEAVLLRQILQESQRPMFPSKLIGNSTTDSIYRDLVVNQLAENISQSGSFGLAKSLTGELQRQTSAGPAQGRGRADHTPES